MGSNYDYVCSGCGYTAHVSGGRDVGMHAVIRTMTCDDCREVLDVLIGCCGEDGPTGDPEFDKDLNICPKCRGRNLKRWPSKHPCPKCGKMMVKNPNTRILWD